MNKILILLALLLLAGGCGSSKPTAEAEAPTVTAAVEMATVEQRDVEETLPVDGTFVFAEGASARIAPTAAGRLAKVLVKEGDRVKAGQLLAVVDSRILADQSTSAAAGASSAAVQAAESKVILESSAAEQLASVRSAQLALESAESETRANIEQAEIELRRLKTGARPQEIAQAEQAVAQAQITRNKAKTDLDRMKKLFAEGFVAGQDVDAAQTTFELSESSLRSAKSGLDLVRLGPREEEVTAAQSRLRSARELGSKRIAQAKAALKQAEQGRLNVVAKAKEADSTKLLAAQRAADALAAQQAAQNGELRSPIDGFVTRRLLNAGDMADTTVPVLEVASVRSRLDFAGSVTPDEAARLSVGMVVRGPEGRLGTLTAVGTASAASGMVTVRATFRGGAGVVRAGSFATVRVVLAKLKSSMTVPTASVLKREDKTVVFVVKDGVAKLTEVTVGPVSDDSTAIRSGVKIGDQIVILGQHELSDGTKVEPIKKAAKEETP